MIILTSCNLFYYSRVSNVKEEGIQIVDVDGSYLYRKYMALLPAIPQPPISGWIVMDSTNYQSLSASLPCVTQGTTKHTSM